MQTTIYIELGECSFLECVPVDVEFRCDPYRPAQISGPVEACYPAEGGEVDVERADALLGPGLDEHLNVVDLRQRVQDDGACLDELAQYDADHSGPDPDELYDRYRDEGW